MKRSCLSAKKKALLRILQVSLCLGPLAVLDAFEVRAPLRLSSRTLRRQYLYQHRGNDRGAASAPWRPRQMSPDDSADRAEPLPLSVHDLKRLRRLQARRTVMPIMIVDSILPRQSIHFRSDDPKFRRMVEHCLAQPSNDNVNLNDDDDDMDDDDYGSSGGVVGVIGLNPHTGRPISRGVCVPVNRATISTDDKGGGTVTLHATGHQRMEVQGQAWLDESGSFYLADVELVEDRVEVLTEEQMKEVKRLSKTMPEKLREWVGWVIKSGATDRAGMEAYVNDLGPMPKDPTDRAFWVAALVNPLPALGVCLEIRPAMLSCSNDLDRMILATQALQSSIDHLSGKNRLFN